MGQRPQAPCTCSHQDLKTHTLLGTWPFESMYTEWWLAVGREDAYLDTGPVQSVSSAGGIFAPGVCRWHVSFSRALSPCSTDF